MDSPHDYRAKRHFQIGLHWWTIAGEYMHLRFEKVVINKKCILWIGRIEQSINDFFTICILILHLYQTIQYTNPQSNHSACTSAFLNFIMISARYHLTFGWVWSLSMCVCLWVRRYHCPYFLIIDYDLWQQQQKINHYANQISRSEFFKSIMCGQKLTNIDEVAGCFSNDCF